MSVRISDEVARGLLKLVENAIMAGPYHEDDLTILISTRERLSQLLSDDNRNEELIDKIGKIVNHPYCSTQIGGRMLHDLRQVVLTELEVNKFINGPVILSCASCGSHIENYEAALPYDGEFHCLRCRHPEYIKCSHESCDHVLPISTKLAKALRETRFCADHRPGAQINQAEQRAARPGAQMSPTPPTVTIRPDVSSSVRVNLNRVPTSPSVATGWYQVASTFNNDEIDDDGPS